MKKQLLAAMVIVIVTIITTSFTTTSQDENVVLENIDAIVSFDQKLGQTCTMGCHGLDYFYVCVMCGIQTTDPCTFNFRAEGIGDRSTCGAEN